MLPKMLRTFHALLGFDLLVLPNPCGSSHTHMDVVVLVNQNPNDYWVLRPIF